jgi:hypothetical protein
VIKRFFLASGLTLLLAASAAAADIAAPLSTPELRQSITAGKTSTIVFFMNPYGQPCIAQNGILLALREARKNDFAIAYVRTDRPTDRQAFYDYGVRNLPSLFLVDKAGKVRRVFPPGIQDRQVLSAALDGIRK